MALADDLIDNDEKEASSQKNIPSSRQQCKNHILFMTKFAKIDALFMAKTAEKPSLGGCTYLYRPYKGVAPGGRNCPLGLEYGPRPASSSCPPGTQELEQDGPPGRKIYVSDKDARNTLETRQISCTQPVHKMRCKHATSFPEPFPSVPRAVSLGNGSGNEIGKHDLK